MKDTNYLSELLKLKKEKEILKRSLDTFLGKEQRNYLFEQLKKAEYKINFLEFKEKISDRMKKNEKSR